MSRAKHTTQRRRRSPLQRAMKGIGPRPGSFKDRKLDEAARRARAKIRAREAAEE